jgi:hypothetical protein
VCRGTPSEDEVVNKTPGIDYINGKKQHAVWRWACEVCEGVRTLRQPHPDVLLMSEVHSGGWCEPTEPPIWIWILIRPWLNGDIEDRAVGLPLSLSLHSLIWVRCSTCAMHWVGVGPLHNTRYTTHVTQHTLHNTHHGGVGTELKGPRGFFVWVILCCADLIVRRGFIFSVSLALLESRSYPVQN